MQAAARRDEFHRRLSGYGAEPLAFSMVFRSYFRVWVMIIIRGTILEVGVTGAGGSTIQIDDGSQSSCSLPTLRNGLPAVTCEQKQRRVDDEQAVDQCNGTAQSAV